MCVWVGGGGRGNSNMYSCSLIIASPVVGVADTKYPVQMEKHPLAELLYWVQEW